MQRQFRALAPSDLVPTLCRIMKQQGLETLRRGSLETLCQTLYTNTKTIHIMDLVPGNLVPDYISYNLVPTPTARHKVGTRTKITASCHMYTIEYTR